MSSDLACLTGETAVAQVLPALDLLAHRVRVLPADPQAVLSGRTYDAILVDARRDMASARDLCRLLSAGTSPVLVVVDEGGLVAVNAEWGVDDVLLPTAGPAEVDARLRLTLGRCHVPEGASPDTFRAGELLIEEATYTARLRGRALELTFKEFELLKFLAQHPDRVFTRAQLLHEVWGYDFFGGTRTVDVHVRRLRAKLGPEHDSMLGTVRGVGYKFVVPAHNGRESGVIGTEHAAAKRANRAATTPGAGDAAIAEPARQPRSAGVERTR